MAARGRKDKAAKNDPFRFQGDGITFKGKLIGSEAVSHARGDRMCADAMTRLKSVVKASGEHKQRVSLTVSLEGIKVFDEKTHELMCHHPVHRISFISQDQTDPRAFGYVSGTPQGGHSFIAIKTEKAATQIVIALRDLFQVVLEMRQHEMKRRSGSSASTGSAAQNLDGKDGKRADRNSSASSTNNDDETNGNPECPPQLVVVDDLLDLQNEMDCLRQGIDQIEEEITTAETAFGADPFGSTSEVSQASSVIESNGYFQPNKVCLPPVSLPATQPPPVLPPPPTNSLPSTPRRSQIRQGYKVPSAVATETTPNGAPAQASMTLPKGFTSGTSASSWFDDPQLINPSSAQGTTSDMTACTCPPLSGGSSVAVAFGSSDPAQSTSFFPPQRAPLSATLSHQSHFNFDNGDFSKSVIGLPPPPRGSQQGRSATPSSGALFSLTEAMNSISIQPTSNLSQIDLTSSTNRVALSSSSASPKGGLFNEVFENSRPNSGKIGLVTSTASADSVFDDFRFDAPQPIPVQREANFSASQFSFDSVASSLSRVQTQDSTDTLDFPPTTKAAADTMGSSSSFGSSTLHSGSEVASPKIIGGLSNSPQPADKYAVFAELKQEESHNVASSSTKGLEIQSPTQPKQTNQTSFFSDFNVSKTSQENTSFFNDSGFNMTAGFNNFNSVAAKNEFFPAFEQNVAVPDTKITNNFFGQSSQTFEAKFDAFTGHTGPDMKINEPAKRPPMLNAAMRGNPFCALSTESTPSEDFNTPPIGGQSTTVAPTRGIQSNDNSVCSPSDATTATNQFVSATSSPLSDRFMTVASGSSLSSSENDLSSSVIPTTTLSTQFPPFAFDAPSQPAVTFASPVEVVAPSPGMHEVSTAANPFSMGSFTGLSVQNGDLDEGFCGSNASSVSPYLPQKRKNTSKGATTDFTSSFPNDFKNHGSPIPDSNNKECKGIFKKKDDPFNEDFFNMLNSAPAEGPGQQQMDTFWSNNLLFLKTLNRLRFAEPDGDSDSLYRSDEDPSRPFLCLVCGFRARFNSHMRVHVRIHTGYKPYACSFCEYRTTQKGNIKIHITKRHNVPEEDVNDILTQVNRPEPMTLQSNFGVRLQNTTRIS